MSLFQLNSLRKTICMTINKNITSNIFSSYISLTFIASNED
jgi:hypothetical protein